jgi:hypothetical protein
MQVMLDTIGSTNTHIPTSTAKVAGYVTGSSDIIWPQADWDHFPHSAHIRIDQSPDGRMPLQSDVLDVESGAATADTAVAWIKARMHAGITWSTIYGGADTLAAVRQALDAAGPHGWYWGHVNAWLADWNLNETSATAMLGQQSSGLTIIAVQWASPTSNPHTPVPGGSGETLSQANIDISVTTDSWMPAPGTPPPPPAVRHGILVEASATSGTYSGRNVASSDGGATWR